VFFKDLMKESLDLFLIFLMVHGRIQLDCLLRDI